MLFLLVIITFIKFIIKTLFTVNFSLKYPTYQQKSFNIFLKTIFLNSLNKSITFTKIFQNKRKNYKKLYW